VVKRPRLVFWLGTVLIACIAMGTVVRAASHFNQTYDEGAHIAAGMEWLQAGSYWYDPQHPPLARVAVALGPMLDGAALEPRASLGGRSMWEEGNALLVAGGHYERRLALARLGVLPFFALLLVVVWAWTRRLYGDGAAVLAVALTATMPQLLAHAGLATTDLPVTATLCWALYAFAQWIERPSRRRTAAFAVAGGLAIVSKFSSLPFFAIAAVLIVLARWLLGEPGTVGDGDAPPHTTHTRWSWRALRPYAGPAIAAAIGAGLVVWATYRFHLALAHGFIPVPAPELLDGIRQLARHNHEGHAAYLLGQVRHHGWWYYSLVVLAVKTPLAFLALSAIAIGYTVGAVRRGLAGWRELAPLLGVAGVLITAMLASIDIGVRHILPIYPLLAIPAAGAVVALWPRIPHRAPRRIVLAALVVWQVAAAARAYPDFLSDFNALAGRHPDRVLVDSNIDWGQDLEQLADTLAARHVSSLSLFYFGTTPVGALRLADTVRIGGAERATGWVAASRTYVRGVYAGCFTWLANETPVAEIGRSILLYRILPDTAPRLPDGVMPIRSSAAPYGELLGRASDGSPCTRSEVLVKGGATLVTNEGPVSMPVPAQAPEREREGGSGSAASSGSSVASSDPSGSAVASDPLLRVTDRMLLGAAKNPNDWLVYGRDYSNRRYSPLTQITAGNVQHLRLAWVHQLESQPGYQESSPIEAGGVIYYTGPMGMLMAVDATTGAELWRHQHKLATVPTCCGAVNRGVAVYDDKVYLTTLDDHLVALDARSGRVLWDTQVIDPAAGYSMTSAPLAVQGKIVVGVSGSEFPIRGFVDAYDAETGKHVWRFYTIPSPEEGGWWGKWSPTTPDGDRLPRDIAREKRDSARYADAWRTGGGGVWNTPSFDPELQLIYFGVGNPAPNMDASVRPGDNLYTASIVALDINTGKLRWYYQQVPHDEWDYDAASPTVLFDVTIDGARVPALAQAGKVGWVYILDRRTGARIHRSAPFVPHENTFAAPTPEGVRIMPGMGGGNNSAPPSYSPRTGLLYVSGIVEPILFMLAPAPIERGVKWQGGRHVPLAPATGTFTAIDVATGKIRWQTRTAQRMLGTGSLVTASDLVFYGEQQGVFHAADARTGKVLWSARTGGHVRAPPITYAIGGRQYVAIAAGSALFAFTLER
jgi:PQQ-dependent dehydrogenase (methanol/ethanol family)